MTRWEYACIHIARMVFCAEDFGRDGWEMVCAAGDYVWFKRPLSPEPCDDGPQETPC